MSHYSQRADAGTGDWLMGAVRRNPEGLLLLAAGCALLMRSVGGSRAADSTGRHEFRRTDRSQQVSSGVDDEGKGWSVGESVAQAARSAGEYAADVTERVTQTASSYASSASEYAEDAARAASEQSRRFARQAQSSAKHALEEQPLAVVLVGLAAGAAVAAAFPATQFEKRALGPTGARLRDAAGRAGEQLKDAGAKAGERLMSAAEERGLTSDGLKEVARDVGDAFSSALSGEPSTPSGKGESQNGEGPRGTSGRSQVRKDPGTTSSAQSNPGGKRGPR